MTLLLDIDALLAFHRSTFGDIRMEAVDDAEEKDAVEAAVDDAEEKDAVEAAVDDAEEKDWQSEFKAQQRINRDLERKMKQRTRDLERQLADVAANKSTDGAAPSVEELTKKIREETKAESLRERALDKLEAKAARLFQDPEDARAFLAGNVDDFIDGQSVDVAAITSALNDLLEKRPYLGVTQGDEKRFKGGADGGNRGTAGKAQMTEAEVKALAAQNKHEEIEQARVDGRLNDYLGIK